MPEPTVLRSSGMERSADWGRSSYRLLLALFFLLGGVAARGLAWAEDAPPASAGAASGESNSGAGGFGEIQSEEALKQLAARGGKIKVVLASTIKKTPGISGLRLTEEQVPLRLAPAKGRLVTRVELRGVFDRPGWALFAQKTQIVAPAKSSTDFKAQIQPTAGASRILVTGIGPNGEIEADTVVFLSSDIEEYRLTPSWGELAAYLGGDHISYSHPQLSTLFTANASLTVNYKTPKFRSPLGLIARGRLTALSLYTSQKGQEPQMFDGRLDASYRLWRRLKEWEAYALLGAAVYSTITYGSSYGFGLLAVIDAGTRWVWLLDSTKQIRFDLRYNPIGSFTKEWGISLDIDYVWENEGKHRIFIGPSWTNLAFLASGTTSQALLNWVGLHAGYSF